MSKRISHEELLKAVREQSFIKRGFPGCAVDHVYRFQLSGTMLKRTSDSRVEVIEIEGPEGSMILVKPGETLFVVTKEVLALPANLKVRLVPSESLSSAGIEVLGKLELGCHFYGRVLLGFYNPAFSPIRLRWDAAIVSGVFYDLLGSEALQNNGN